MKPRIYKTRRQEVRELLDAMAEDWLSQKKFRSQMQQLGTFLAEDFLNVYPPDSPKDLVLICTSEDADFLAQGFLKQIEQSARFQKVALVCFWNERYKIGEQRIVASPHKYQEPMPQTSNTVVILKSLISGACVVKTNLLSTLETLKNQPDSIYIVSPILREGAEGRLQKDFPKTFSRLFEYIFFAVDHEKDDVGMVLPGLGPKDYYEMLGWQNQEKKNRFRPELVTSRHLKYLESLN